MRLLLILFVTLMLLSPAVGHAQDNTTLPIITPENMDQVRLLGVGRADYHTAFLDDGRLLATYSEDVRLLWDLTTATYQQISGVISDDGRLLVTRSTFYDDPGVSHIIELSTGREQALIRAPQANFGSFVVFSPDGRLLIAPFYAVPRSAENGLNVWDTTTGELLATLGNHNSDEHVFYRLAFSPDGETLAAAARNSVEVWDLDTFSLRAVLESASDQVIFSPDGQTLVTRAENGDKQVRLWDMSSELPTLRASFLPPYTDYLWVRMRFSPSGRFLVTSADSGETVDLWDPLSGDLVYSFFVGNTVGYDLTNVLFDSDETIFTYLTRPVDEDVARFWNVTTGEEINTSQIFQQAVFSTVQPILIGETQSLTIIDIRNGLNDESPTFSLIYTGERMVMSPDGSTFVVYDQGVVMVFGIPTPQRSEWQPIQGNIPYSGINVRAAPSYDAEVIDYAGGDVRVGGRNGDFVYLPDLGGWMLGMSDYLDLGEYTLDDLPVIAP
jgi:WD40 repeat protein